VVGDDVARCRREVLQSAERSMLLLGAPGETLACSSQHHFLVHFLVFEEGMTAHRAA
jgi:hypothetical protein